MFGSSIEANVVNVRVACTSEVNDLYCRGTFDTDKTK